MASMPSRETTTDPPPGLPTELVRDIVGAGYFPDIVQNVVSSLLGSAPVKSHLVHQETIFDHTEEVRRHVTVAVLTDSRLVAAHVDDHGPDSHSSTPVIVASNESIPISRIHSVLLSTVVPQTDAHLRGNAGAAEATLSLSWGSTRRLEFDQASCGDPMCEADHGYSGIASAEGIDIRVSAAAEGADAVQRVIRFAQAVSSATDTS